MFFKKSISFVLITFLLTLSLSGILTNPTQASVTPAISNGTTHSLALKSDGTVWAWGDVGGALGYGVSPIQLTGLDGIKKISCGHGSSLVLKSDGTVWKVGSTIDQIADLYDVVDIAYSGSTGIVCKTDGTVWTWGSNTYGQLGNGTTTYSSVPVQVLDINGTDFLCDVIKVSCGTYHCIVVKSDGTVLTWGRNNAGQLGIGYTSTNGKIPVQPVITDVIAVASGDISSLALKSDGTLWSWGSNSSGQLGTGKSTSTYSYKPVQVKNITNVVDIDMKGYAPMALKSDGTVWAWGGDSSILSPKQISGITNIIDIGCGKYFSSAVESDGTVWTWGANNKGQLGNNSTTGSSTPVRVVGPGGEGFLNLLSSNEVVITVTTPQPNAAYSGVIGHNVINVSGTISGLDDATVTVTLNCVNDETFTPIEKSEVLTTGEFSIEFKVVEDAIPSGIYKITVKAE